MRPPLVQAARHCLREANEGLLRHPALTLLAVLSIGVSLYVFGLFALLAFNLNRLVQDLGRELQMQIYLEAAAKPEEIRALRESLLTDPAVGEVRFVTPDEARRRFEARFPGLREVTGAIAGDVFPPSFEVILRPGYRDADAAERLARGFRLGAGVQEVRYDRDWFERLRSLIALMRGGGYGVGTLLLLAVMVTAGTVVRLTVLARREEIEIMKLVGATNWFVRLPFMLEGIAAGVAGAVIAVLLLIAGKALARSQVPAFIPTTALNGVALGHTVWLVILGITVGALGSAVAVRRFLEV